MMTAQASRIDPLAMVAVAEPRRRRLRRLRNRNLLIGLAVMTLLVLVAVFAPILAPYPPQQQNYSLTQQAPSLSHPFGTDNFGRDIFSRVIYGTRIDLRVGLFSVL